MAAHDEFEQVLGRGVREFAHALVVDDQQGHGGQIGEERFAGAVDRRIGEVLNERVRLATPRDSLVESTPDRSPRPDGFCRCPVGRAGSRNAAGRDAEQRADLVAAAARR